MQILYIVFAQILAARSTLPRRCRYLADGGALPLGRLDASRKDVLPLAQQSGRLSAFRV